MQKSLPESTAPAGDAPGGDTSAPQKIKWRKPVLTSPAHASITVRFDDGLVDEIEAFRSLYPLRPTITDTIRFLVKAGLQTARADLAARVQQLAGAKPEAAE